MAGTMGLHGARRLAWLPAVAVLSVLAGCQSGGSTMGVVPASAPPGAIVPPAGSPISVTVAPAVVAPGATQTSMPVPSLVAVAPRPAPYVAPCGRYPSPKQIPLQVSPGSGSAVVGWLSDGDSTVRSYRVSAISQQLVAGNQPAPPTVTTARGVSCGPLRISFTGLQHGAGYVFWLEEGDPDPAGGLRYWQVGQTAGVLVP